MLDDKDSIKRVEHWTKMLKEVTAEIEKLKADYEADPNQLDAYPEFLNQMAYLLLLNQVAVDSVKRASDEMLNDILPQPLWKRWLGSHK